MTGSHRATTFEIFFDLVLVFALTRFIGFMAETRPRSACTKGLLLPGAARTGGARPADGGADRAGLRRAADVPRPVVGRTGTR
ncbi:hypothetical protein GCM10027452_30100 [Micromonospora halotolerans]